MNHPPHHPTRPVRNELYASQLNNQGAKFLESQDFQLAIACFSESLRFCRGFVQRNIVTAADGPRPIHRQQEQEQHPSHNDRTNGSCASPQSLNGIMAFQLQSGSHVTEGHVSSDRQESFIYRHAIQVPVPTTSRTVLDTSMEGEEDSPKVHFMLSITVLFNLALAHQLMAEQQQQPPLSSAYRQSLLEKSVRLYQLGHTLLSNRDQSDQVIVENDPMAFSQCEILVLAMTNNLAVAYQSMGNFELSERAFQHVLSLLHLCVYYGIHELYPTVLACFVDSAAAHCVEKSSPPPASAA